MISGFSCNVNEITALLGFYAAYIGSLLLMLDNLLVPSSRVKQSKKNAGNTCVCSCVGNGVGNEWSSENVMPASRVSGILGLLDP